MVDFLLLFFSAMELLTVLWFYFYLTKAKGSISNVLSATLHLQMNTQQKYI